MKYSIKGKDFMDELNNHLNSLACSFISVVIAHEALIDKLIEKNLLSKEDVAALKIETTKRYSEAIQEMSQETKETTI